MADLKISQLPASTTPLAGAEILPVVQSGVTKQVSVANLTAGRAMSASQLNVNTGADGVSSNLFGRALDNASSVFFYNNANTAQYGNIFANASEVGIQSIGARPLSLGANGTTHFQVNTTGNLVVIGAGKGIDFSADPSAAGMTSELLADYEEGIFTPVIEGTVTVGTATYGSSVGRYTKIGRQVSFEIAIDWSAGSGAGFLRIGGLPFTSSSTATYPAAAIGIIDSIALAITTYPTAFVRTTSTQISLRESLVGGGASTDVTYDAAGFISLSGFYTV
jgi:hypothetical protein